MFIWRCEACDACPARSNLETRYSNSEPFPMTTATMSHKKAERIASNAGALLSQREVARLFNVSPRHLRRLIDAGKIPGPDLELSERVHRWRYSTLQPLLEGTRRRA